MVFRLCAAQRDSDFGCGAFCVDPREPERVAELYDGRTDHRADFGGSCNLSDHRTDPVSLPCVAGIRRIGILIPRDTDSR